MQIAEHFMQNTVSRRAVMWLHTYLELFKRHEQRNRTQYISSMETCMNLTASNTRTRYHYTDTPVTCHNTPVTTLIANTDPSLRTFTMQWKPFTAFYTSRLQYKGTTKSISITSLKFNSRLCLNVSKSESKTSNCALAFIIYEAAQQHSDTHTTRRC